LLLLALAASAPARAQESTGSSSSAYAVAGIDVDVSAANPVAARNAAFRIAQRKAWPLLWSRLTGNPAGGAPHLSDGQLDSIVSGIESQGERFSTTRYIARLGVVFDRSRTGEYFSGANAALQSPPMLLLPLFADGGARTLFQAKTPWRAAWLRFRENVTPLDYVLASGSAGDNILLTNWQVTRPDRPSWRNILNRFDTVDVLTAEARLVRSWPGGPITGTFIARHGPDATELGRVSLRAADDAGLDAMLDTAVRQLDEIYAAALQDGRLRSEPDLTADLAPIIGNAPMIGEPEGGDLSVSSAPSTSIDAAMATPDAATAAALEALLRGTPGVTGVTITSLSLGGTSRLLLSHTGARDALLFELDNRGLRLVSENGQMVIRRRREGDVPVPRPITAPPVPAPADPANLPPGVPVEPVQRPADPRKPAPKPGPGPVDLVPNGGE
jgi:hypothetical protein